MLKNGDIYTDAQGNKIVQPIFNGEGGTVCGVIEIIKKAA